MSFTSFRFELQPVAQ